jgi:hypothetical protein
MPVFDVTMRDPGSGRGWRHPETGKETDELAWTVEAADADAAKAFAEEHNPGLEATAASER